MRSSSSDDDTLPTVSVDLDNEKGRTGCNDADLIFANARAGFMEWLLLGDPKLNTIIPM